MKTLWLLFFLVPLAYDQRTTQQGGADSTTESLWHLNETAGITAYDSATDNNGTHAGTVTLEPCLWGHCRNYDGATDYTAINSGLVMDTDAYTVSLWVNMAPGADGRLYSEGHTNAPFLQAFCELGRGHDSSNKILFYCRDNTLSNTTFVYGTSVVADNTWHFCAVTYDGTTAIVYVDGLFENSGAFSGGSRTLSCNTINGYAIGVGCVTHGSFVNGSIEEVRTDLRVLTPAEIWHRYTSQAKAYQ